jgi:hypothetical protein
MTASRSILTIVASPVGELLYCNQPETGSPSQKKHTRVLPSKKNFRVLAQKLNKSVMLGKRQKTGVAPGWSRRAANLDNKIV